MWGFWWILLGYCLGGIDLRSLSHLDFHIRFFLEQFSFQRWTVYKSVVCRKSYKGLLTTPCQKQRQRLPIWSSLLDTETSHRHFRLPTVSP
jgi:hypothetical protein